MSKEKFRIVVTSASSETAKSLRETLPSTIFHKADVRFLDEEDVQGTLMEYDKGVELIKTMTLESFYEKDLAFFCGDSGKTKETIATVVSEYGDSSPVMIDLSCPSSKSRSEVFLQSLKNKVDFKDEKVIPLPNPLATGIATSIDLISRLEEIDSVNISAQVPVSEIGKRGIEDLQNQMVELINHGEIPDDGFGQQLIFNVIPGFGNDPAFTFSDYEKSTLDQVSYLLGNPGIDIALATSMGPVFFAFFLDVFIKFKGAPDYQRIKSGLSKFEGFSVEPKAPLPGPIQATKSQIYQVTRVVPTGNTGIMLSLSFDNIYTASVKPALEIAEDIFRDDERLK